MLQSSCRRRPLLTRGALLLALASVLSERASAQSGFDCSRAGGSFAGPEEIVWGDLDAAPATGDFDGDGTTDLLIAEDGEFRILLRDPVAGLVPQTPFSAPGVMGRVRMADVNGDGVMDLTYGTWFSGSNIEVRLMNADATPGLRVTTPLLIPGATSGPHWTADVTGDGILDVVRLVGNLGEVVVLTGDGTGAFTLGTRTPVDDESVDVVISNGVINLSFQKRRVFEEIFRVLNPGGRISVTDIVSAKQLSQSIVNDPKLWAS